MVWTIKTYIEEKSFMTYCFVYQMSYEDTIRETSIELVGDAQNPLQQNNLKLAVKLFQTTNFIVMIFV